MTKNEIMKVLEDLIDEYLNKIIGTDELIDKLINKIDPEEIYILDNEPLITDCFFAIKHLTEDGYETTLKELQYFRECFLGLRVYDLNEKNLYI